MSNEDDEIFHPDLYDISDCTHTEKYNKECNELTMKIRSESRLNAMKIYFYLKLIVEEFERKLNIMDPDQGKH